MVETERKKISIWRTHYFRFDGVVLLRYIRYFRYRYIHPSDQYSGLCSFIPSFDFHKMKNFCWVGRWRGFLGYDYDYMYVYSLGIFLEIFSTDDTILGFRGWQETMTTSMLCVFFRNLKSMEIALFSDNLSRFKLRLMIYGGLIWME